MHPLLPWGASASGLPAQAEQHAGWRPDWRLQHLLESSTSPAEVKTLSCSTVKAILDSLCLQAVA